MAVKFNEYDFLDAICLSPKVAIHKGDEIPFVEMANVATGNRKEPMAIEMRKFSGGTKFEKNDTVVASIEPCLQHGKSFYFTEHDKGAGSTEYLVFRGIDGITTNEFVYYFMMSYEIRAAMIRSMKGATGRQRVDPEVFTGMRIELPDISTQKKIVGILSDYDAAIANCRKQISLLEDAAMRLYREWFKQTKKVGVHLRDFIFFQEGPGIRNWQYVDTKGVRFINIRCINNGDVDISSANMISTEEAYGKYSHFQLKEDDIVMSCSGTLGRSAVIRRDHLPLCLNTSVIRFRPKKDSRDYAYVYCYLNSEEFLHAQKAMANGAAQMNFGPKHLNMIEMQVPEDSKRFGFGEMVMPMLESKKNLFTHIKALTEARNRLLPKLMKGEVEV